MGGCQNENKLELVKLNQSSWHTLGKIATNYSLKAFTSNQGDQKGYIGHTDHSLRRGEYLWRHCDRSNIRLCK